MLNRHMRRAAKAVGLAQPAPKEARKVDEIRQEYGQACASAGELQYKIGEFQSQLKDVNDSIRRLNLEYSEALKAQPAPKEPKAEEVK